MSNEIDTEDIEEALTHRITELWLNIIGTALLIISTLLFSIGLWNELHLNKNYKKLFNIGITTLLILSWIMLLVSSSLHLVDEKKKENKKNK